MTEQDQLQAIAEICGYELYQQSEGLYRHSYWMRNGKQCYIPDYTHSLDAMHEAESTLTNPEMDAYLWWVKDRCARDGESCCEIEIMRATASQRAEAFLRTKGKWRDAANAEICHADPTSGVTTNKTANGSALASSKG